MTDVPPYLSLPDLDRNRSPRTGWGRGHWEAVADHLLASTAPYATADGAQLRMPGRNSRSGVVSDGLEGFARTFLLAAFRIAGAGGIGVDGLIERYSRGVAAGTDPANVGRWPSIVDRSQQMVEAASIALALHETRAWIFDRLTATAQDNVRAWLGGFVGKRTWDNNWILFQVITEQFLATVDGPHDPAEIERGLDTIEAWYRGDGWYSDGSGANYDYYIGWAMHLYPLLWTRMSGDTQRAEVYRERLRAFLGQYQHFFGADGAPMHQGRSLTYRFACAAPLWVGALFDASPLAPGQTRRLTSDVLRHFVERGAPDRRGLLSLGWYEQFLPTTQEYSGPGSPYWASKAFVGLLLPADHPVWTDPERLVANDLDDAVTALPVPGYVLSSTVHDGVVRLLNHGSDHNLPAPAPAHDDPHYSKLAYSTHTGPQAAPAAWAANIDNQVVLLDAAGVPTRRRRIERVGAFDRYGASWHAAQVDGAEYRLETAAIAHGPWELRVHLITGPAAPTSLDDTAEVPATDPRDNGRAEPGPALQVTASEPTLPAGSPPQAATGPGVRDGGHAVAGHAAPATATGDRWASTTRADGLTSAAIGLHGWTGAGIATAVEANAFGPYSAVPYLRAAHHPGGDAVYVSLIVLSGDTVHPDALADGFAVSVAGRNVAIRYPDGELLRLHLGGTGTAPRYLRLPPGGNPVVLRD